MEYKNLTPVERIPAKWYEALNNFLGRQDPSGLTVDMLENVVTEEELLIFKDLFTREEKLIKMDAYEAESSPLQLSQEELQLLWKLTDVVETAANRVIRKINSFWSQSAKF